MQIFSFKQNILPISRQFSNVNEICSKICIRIWFQHFSNVSFQALAISIHWNLIQSIRSDLNPFGPVWIHSVRFESIFFMSISRLWIRFNPFLFPIQSNRSDTTHSVRFDPIQVGSEFNSIQFVVSDSIQSVRFTRSDLIRFNSV